MTHLLRISLYCLALIFSATLHANITTTRAGCMSMQGVTGNLYSMQAQLLVTSYPDSTDEMELDWGDGNVQIRLMTDFPVTPTAQGFIISVYATHSYPSGSYTTYLRAGTRVPFISNIPSSDTTRFGLVAFLYVDPYFGCDGGPKTDSALLQIDMPLYLVTAVMMDAIDAQGDSIHWMLTSPGNAVGYTYPDVNGGGGFVQYPGDTVMFEWDPQFEGLYSVMIAYSDYKQMPSGNWIALGVSTREILLDAGGVSALQEQFAQSFSVYPNPANDLLHFSVKQEYVELMNMHGATVLTASQTNVMDVSSLASGIYLLKTTHGVQKVVIE